MALAPSGDSMSAANRIDSRARLAGARVLVVGADPGGARSIQYVAMFGLETLGIVDDQPVDDADVAASPIFQPADVGMPRARAAAEWVRSVAPATVVRVHPIAPASAAATLFDDYDVVIDRAPVGDDVPTITAAVLEARLAERSRGLDGFTLLDVRERGEHDVDSIGGSLLAAGFGSTSAVWPALERGQPVVVVCDRGIRARAAARLLRADGHDVVVLERGMRGWNLRPGALARGAGEHGASGRVPLPLADIDPEGFRPNLHS